MPSWLAPSLASSSSIQRGAITSFIVSCTSATARESTASQPTAPRITGVGNPSNPARTSRKNSTMPTAARAQCFASDVP